MSKAFSILNLRLPKGVAKKMENFHSLPPWEHQNCYAVGMQSGPLLQSTNLRLVPQAMKKILFVQTIETL